VAKTPEDGARVAAPSDWQGWQRWVEGVDWSDWRSWLQRVASTDWAPGQTAEPPWQGAAQGGAVSLTVRAYEEDEPGDQIREQLAATWPAFHRWWRDGANTRPAAGEARARLEEHMPELVPTWERLTAMIPGESDAGAALALWNPPPFLTGCSQAAVLDGGPALIRNYDWDYRIFDGVVARTAYTGRRVLGMLDCLWGLLDGVNDSGLAISADVRGPARGRRGLRHPAGDPLRARGLRDR
jgi:hypothetical protein